MRAGLGNVLVTVLRRSSVLLGPSTATPTMSFAVQPVRAAALLVTVAGGQTGSGEVTVSGTVDGLPATEVLTFVQNGGMRTTRKFSSASLTTTGLADETPTPTITVSAIDASGGAAVNEVAVATGVPASKSYATTASGDTAYGNAAQGSRVDDLGQFGFEPSEVFDPREGDIILEEATGYRWLIRRVQDIASGFRPKGWQVEATRDKTTR